MLGLQQFSGPQSVCDRAVLSLWSLGTAPFRPMELECSNPNPNPNSNCLKPSLCGVRVVDVSPMGVAEGLLRCTSLSSMYIPVFFPAFFQYVIQETQDFLGWVWEFSLGMKGKSQLFTYLTRKGYQIVKMKTTPLRADSLSLLIVFFLFWNHHILMRYELFGTRGFLGFQPSMMEGSNSLFVHFHRIVQQIIKSSWAPQKALQLSFLMVVLLFA
ncbi:unnamed protein product [Discosporangium mesarthrocarpum]